MRTRKVIRPPYTVQSLMRRRAPSKIIRYTKENWRMADEGLAGINLWIILDSSDKVTYYDDTWTTRWTIYFTDTPISVNGKSGHFILVWRWNRSLMALSMSFKTFKQAERMMDCAIGASYWLGRHAEAFRTGEYYDDDTPELDFVNTLSGGIDNAIACFHRKK